MENLLINYVILVGRRTDITPLYIPDNMHQEVLRWLPGMPHSIAHYLGADVLLDAILNIGGKSGLKITWVYEDGYDDILSDRFKEMHTGFKVYVVSVSSDEEIACVNGLLNRLDDDGSSVVWSLSEKIQAHAPVAKGRDQLLDLIEEYAGRTFPQYHARKRAPHILKDSLDCGYLFNPTVPNTHILHSALGDFRFPVKRYSMEEKQSESSAAINEEDSFNRQQKLIEQLKSFDRIDDEIFISRYIAPWLSEQRKSPLIVSIPYNSKDVIDSVSADVPQEFKEIQKSVKTALKIGQTKNYTTSKTVPAAEILAAVTTLSLPRSRYLDILCGLHATLRFSPILRLPCVGSAFNKKLSWVAPVASSRLMAPNKKQSLIKTISEIGRELTGIELSEEAQGFIRQSERQIVAVTDLPIEWLDIDGVPLAFSHDVCRLPEVPYAIAMQHYVIDAHIDFTVPQDILEKTLLVFGSSDSSFLPFQQQAEMQSKTLGYKTLRPKGIAELSDYVNDFKPLLIVFDTHGNYDGRTHETSIQIGDEILRSEDVERLHITAPLIFLSACNTTPVYNLTKTIVNAFVAAGAMAVTASYMPLSIMESSITYMRLLYLLKAASSNCIHKNWLSFISYVLRTSAVHESFLVQYEDVEKDHATHGGVHADMVTKALQFGYRRDVFNQLKRGVKIDDKKISFDNHVPHYLMYTTVGRADLIDFEVASKAIKDALGLSGDPISENLISPIL